MVVVQLGFSHRTFCLPMGDNLKSDLKRELVNMSKTTNYNWQKAAEDAAISVYKDLIKQIQSRVELVGWKCCTE